MIARDGASRSLWQQTVNPLDLNNPAVDRNYDVIIVGGGITGVSLAFQLQQSGLKCVIVEAHSCCFGTTGGTTAHLNTLLDTPYNTIVRNFGEENAKLVCQTVKEAICHIEKNIELYQIECDFERTPAYLFAQDEEQEKDLQEIVKACNKVNVPVTYITSIPISLQFTKAIEIPFQAKFNPVKYVYGMANAFKNAGGEIIENTTVLHHQQRTDEATNESLLEVQTDRGNYIAKALVYATHIPTGVNLLHLRCAPYRSYAMAVKLQSEYPDGLCYDMADPYHYYRTQEMDGEKYLIVGGEDHKTGHEENTAICFNRLEGHVRKYFDVENITHKWSSQYYEPSDGLPYIGILPGAEPHVFVATGYGGNGMVYSQVAAKLISDLIINGSSKYEKVFSPNRIKPIAGFSNFVKENVDVVKSFISGILTRKQLTSLSDIAHGEGKLIIYNKHKIALYKDEKGNLHLLNPTCTHMKCNVNWNVVELSWDCPCHGARYGINGEVLNGPSNRALEKIEIKKE